MSDLLDGPAVLDSLDQRIGAAASVALPDRAVPDAGPEAGTLTAALLPDLVALARRPDRSDVRWLLLVAATGAFPTLDRLRAFRRLLELEPTHVVEARILQWTLENLGRARADLEMTIVTSGVVVDVDHCARFDTHTGIHRVVRETIPRWQRRQGSAPVTTAAWIDEHTALRTLAPREHARVSAYGLDVDIDPADEAAYRARLVVPWRSVVVLPDVPSPGSTAELAALAAASGNTLSMIGYDMIPITSAETRPASDSVTFAQYLTVVKHAHRVAGISRSATAEFTGFAEAVRAQGLAGPRVTEVQLTEDAPPAVEAPAPRPGRPVVLCVGTREPHKNHRTVLHAAERLWRDGLDFDVRLVGGAGWSDAVLRPALERLLAAGHRVHDVGRVSDAALWQELRRADFTVFVSLHEGYGLPVAESLASGTPVVTSNFGSQQEIAELGGCLTVDPRDDDDVTAAMRSLLTDPELLARLRREALSRPRRTWDEYAEDLWEALVADDDPTDHADDAAGTTDRRPAEGAAL